jgi:hypothetical protein
VYVIYTKKFPICSPDSRVIQTTPFPFSPHDCIMLLEYFITYKFLGLHTGMVEGSVHLVYEAGLYLNRKVHCFIRL